MYAHASRVLGPETKEVFAAAMHQGELIIADNLNVGEDPIGKGEYVNK